MFKGPCKGPIIFQVKGLVKAPDGLSTFVDKGSWISFQYLKNFTLTGGGTFHGQGETAWAQNDCHKNSNCKLPIVSVKHEREMREQEMMELEQL